MIAIDTLAKDNRHWVLLNCIREFWTEDRDFVRFPGLKVVHPFA